MKEEKRKKAAGPLKTMSWITYPAEVDHQSQKNHLAQNATIRAITTGLFMSVENADAVGIV